MRTEKELAAEKAFVESGLAMSAEQKAKMFPPAKVADEPKKKAAPKKEAKKTDESKSDSE